MRAVPLASLLSVVLLAGLLLSSAACGDTPTTPTTAIDLQLRGVGCLRPLALPDKWEEHNPTSAAWTQTALFQRYGASPNPGSLLASPDAYYPSGFAGGTGYTSADHGLQLTLRLGGQPAGVAGNELLPISLTGARGVGAFLGSLTGCVDQVVAVQRTLPVETGNLTGPLSQGISQLIAADPAATWNSATNTIDGSCAPACAPQSPRILVLPLFDPDSYQHSLVTGTFPGCSTGACVNIVGLARFFVDSLAGGALSGHLIVPRSAESP